MAPREALHASLVANQRAVMRRVTSLQAAVAKNADIGAKVRPHVKNLALLSAYQVLRDEGVEILLAAGECFSHDDDDGMMTMMMGSR
jgi:hypothetical protein